MAAAYAGHATEWSAVSTHAERHESRGVKRAKRASDKPQSGVVGLAARESIRAVSITSSLLGLHSVFWQATER
jgi:hypothetical protein